MFLGKDNEEGGLTVRMHCVQIQGTDGAETLQAVRSPSLSIGLSLIHWCCSFELGGEKKTKGAALTFVSIFVHRSRHKSLTNILIGSDCRLPFYVVFPFPVIHMQTP